MPFPLPHRCAACHQPIGGDPVFRRDTGYCCASCAQGALCTCRVAADLADDGVDALAMPFGTVGRAGGQLRGLAGLQSGAMNR